MVKHKTDVKQITVRFKPELVSRIDAFLEQIRGEVSWLDLTRSDAVRRLVELGLASVENDSASGKGRQGD